MKMSSTELIERIDEPSRKKEKKKCKSLGKKKQALSSVLNYGH